uniref:Serpentine receptor class gamma n=2 Tax=Panagrellus redivivus TaxID=6233 RepID=A0A7E4W3W9_PANRE
MEEVQPTFVLFSPYKLRHIKWIGYLAKHDSFILATLSLICVTGFRQECDGILSLGYLPLSIFYSFVYLLGRNRNTKQFILTQILFTHGFLIYCPYLMLVAAKNVQTVVAHASGFIFLALILHTFVLQIVHRRHFTKDLSTPESVTDLNKRDAYHALFYGFCIVAMMIVSMVFLHLFPSYLEVEKFEYYIVMTLSVLLAYLTPLFAFPSLREVSYFNSTKEKVTNNYVQYDSDGRAWCCMYLNATDNELNGKNNQVTDET